MAPKLKLTADLPRTPGVYMFRGHGDSVLYVGKATNLRQRVRSYFGSDDRRKIGPMLRETQAITHVELPDPLTAEIVESRFIGRTAPPLQPTRHPRRQVLLRQARHRHAVAATVDRQEPGQAGRAPRSAAVAHDGDARRRRTPDRAPAAPLHANGSAATTPRPTTRRSAAPRSSAWRHCPCSGTADPADYAPSVDARGAGDGRRPSFVVDRLRDRMTELAGQQRFEEAAMSRDRLSALLGAIRRTQLFASARPSSGSAEITIGDTTWIIGRRRARRHPHRPTTLTAALPAAPLGTVEIGRPAPARTRRRGTVPRQVLRQARAPTHRVVRRHLDVPDRADRRTSTHRASGLSSTVQRWPHSRRTSRRPRRPLTPTCCREAVDGRTGA